MRKFHAVALGGDHCDFCTIQPVVKLYQCKNFEWDNQPIFRGQSANMIRAWAACRKCAELIDAGHWTKLTERALRHFRRQHQIPKAAVPVIREQLRQVHLLFRDNRIKPS